MRLSLNTGSPWEFRWFPALLVGMVSKAQRLCSILMWNDKRYCRLLKSSDIFFPMTITAVATEASAGQQVFPFAAYPYGLDPLHDARIETAVLPFDSGAAGTLNA